MKEPRLRAAIIRWKPAVLRIIPGDWAKAGLGWLARPLGDGVRRDDVEAVFTSSPGGVRAPPVNAKCGTERQETMRNRFKPS